jgi:hypothetical protein
MSAKTKKEQVSPKLASNAQKQQEELQQFGLMNAWKETPALVKNCSHQKIVKNLGRCYNEYCCKICNFTYCVDSSD